jgi:hypothetical protein
MDPALAFSGGGWLKAESIRKQGATERNEAALTAFEGIGRAIHRYLWPRRRSSFEIGPDGRVTGRDVDTEVFDEEGAESAVRGVVDVVRRVRSIVDTIPVRVPWVPHSLPVAASCSG